jgi:hypothetical protein
MKVLFYIALVLGALLVITAVDAVPDPPAVKPAVVSVRALTELGGVLPKSECFRGDTCAVLQPLPLRRFDPAEGGKLRRPGDVIALTGYAADPSPPLV